MPPRKPVKPFIPMRESNGRYLRALELIHAYAQAHNRTYRDVMFNLVDNSRVGAWGRTRKRRKSRLEIEPTED